MQIRKEKQKMGNNETRIVFDYKRAKERGFDANLFIIMMNKVIDMAKANGLDVTEYDRVLKKNRVLKNAGLISDEKAFDGLFREFVIVAGQAKPGWPIRNKFAAVIDTAAKYIYDEEFVE